MKRLLIKKAVFALGYVLLAVVMEIVTFLLMGLGVVPEYFGLDLAVIFIIAFIIFIIPNSVAQIVVISFLFAFQIIISIANEALYSMSGMVFSFSMLNLVNEVTGVVAASFLNWWLISIAIVLFGGSLAGFIIFNKKYATPKGVFTRQSVTILVAAFIIAESCAGILYALTVNSFTASADAMQTDDRLSMFYNERELYEEQQFTAKAFSRFGTFGYIVVNIGNSVSSDTYVDEVTADEVDEYFAQGKMSESVYGDNIYTGAVDGKNLVLIVIESGEWFAINKEYTPTLYAMAEGGIAMTDYHARDKTNHSEALSIMGSYPSDAALEPAQVAENSMPYTLPNLLNGAGYTSNYFHLNVGSYYSRNEVFKQLYGFETTHFLDDLPLLDGYENKHGFNDFDKDSELFRNYMDEFTYSEDGGPFFSMFMTLISHGSYTDLIYNGNYPYNDAPESSTDVCNDPMTEEEKEKFKDDVTVKGLEEYYEIVNSLPKTFVTGTPGIDVEYLDNSGNYTDTFLRYKRYQAGIMDLDLGVNMLVKDLESSGELDDTVFMFYADHSCYFDQMNYLMKGIDSSEFYNTHLYKISCFIWYGGSMDLDVQALPVTGYQSVNFTATKDLDSPLQSQKIEKFCNTLDILPTLLQLFGFSYNMNMYQGVSIFSDLESIFVSHESGIFIDNIYFSAIDVFVENDSTWDCYNFDKTYFAKGFSDEVLTFLNRAVDYYDKQTMLDAVVNLDYFAERDLIGGYNGITYIEKIN